MKESEIQSVKQRFGIIGNSPLLNNAIYRAIQVAPTDMTVLITGESGSGKESFSKIIHQLSTRRHGQFIAINCGAIPEGTIYSELFGHEKGAFTGSTEMRKGYFETADGGTIFLDEIGEMPFDSQAMLLRVLESGEYIRMGSSKPLKTNVRVVTATNVDLMKAVQERRFREDLFFRLSTVPIYVPPLRERGADVPLLFRKFATDFAEKYRVEPLSLTEDAKELLTKFRFSGNIRQLKNIVEQMSLFETDARIISADTLRKYLPAESTNHALALWNDSSKTAENASNNSSEREILWKVLFDMRKDVTELKKLVFQLIQSGQVNTEMIQHDLFRNLNIEEAITESDFAQAPATTETVILNSPYSNKEKSLIPIQQSTDERGEAIIHDIIHEVESDSLSLEDKEKELIIKALQKNKNRRKYAAQDLGISERTLYRKIKQYDLEKE
jgi:transcriptional regulator with PAS, ATPase and Fis domain